MGAVYSSIGKIAASADGSKTACDWFRRAAGAFAWLGESGVAAKAVAAGARTVDVMPKCAGMLEKLMLAQAQECLLVDGGKLPALFEMAQQVGIWYKEVYEALSTHPLYQRFHDSWVHHIRLKAAQLRADACYRYSLDLHEKKEIGEEIARLKIGISVLAESKKVATNVAPELLCSVNNLECQMNTNLERAIEENDSIYKMPVPAADSLGDIPAASSVDPISLAETLDASKGSLFNSLLHDDTLEALSEYTEMVAALVNANAEKVLEGRGDISFMLWKMGLPEALNLLERNIAFHVDLSKDLEAVVINGGPAALRFKLELLKDLRMFNWELYGQIEELVKEEKQSPELFRSTSRNKRRNRRSRSQFKNVQHRLNLFAADLHKAARTDLLMEQYTDDNYPLMSMLDERPMEALSTISRSIRSFLEQKPMSLDGNEIAIVDALKRNLDKMDSLELESAVLEKKIEEMRRKDKILLKMMADIGSPHNLHKEITKYNSIYDQIDKNITAQKELLVKVEVQNNIFRAEFNIEDCKASHERYKEFADPIAKYWAISNNIDAGLNFYVKLQITMARMKDIFVSKIKSKSDELLQPVRVQSQMGDRHLTISVTESVVNPFQHREEDLRKIFADHKHRDDILNEYDGDDDLKLLGPHPLLEGQTYDGKPKRWIHTRIELSGPCPPPVRPPTRLPMAPALTSSPPSFRPLSSPTPLRRRAAAAATVLCRAGNGKLGAADDDAAAKTKRPNLFADFGKLTGDAKSLIPALQKPAVGSLFAGGAARGRKDPQTVFVAGATGQAGVRVAQMLLRQGFAVRAGVPDLASAQELARLAAAYGLISPAEARRLNAVESGFDDPEAIAKSIGPAAKVVVTVGPAEKGPEGGAVTTEDALRVVQAADLAGAAHVVVVYDEGAVGGSTYNVLDGFTSFFNYIFSRVQTLTLSQFLAKVVETDVRYTLVKASLTDDYSPESSYALVLSKEGAGRSTSSTTDTGKVSKSQIAALVADVFSNVAVAENKVVEVSTNSSATAKPIAEAFAAIPEDSRRKEYQEAAAKAQAEEEALASQRASEAEAVASKLEAKGKKAPIDEEPSEEAAASPVNGAQASLESLLSRAKGISTDFSWQKLSTQLAEATTPKASSTEKEPTKAQIATVRGQAKAKKLAPQRAVVKPAAAQKAKPQPKQPDTKPEVRPVFGGLFKQETVYVDED